MTAKEMAARIKRLRGTKRWLSPDDDRDTWEHNLCGTCRHRSGVCHRTVLHVRIEPGFYRVWVTTRNRIRAQVFALTPETAGKKARALVSKYGSA